MCSDTAPRLVDVSAHFAKAETPPPAAASVEYSHGQATTVLDHAPAFVGGAIFAWTLQLGVQWLLWQGGCEQQCYMAQAAHAEAELAKQLLHDCRSAAQQTLMAGSALPHEVATINLEGRRWSDISGGHCWGFVILCLDVGLLYFCLLQCASPETRAWLESLLLGAWRCLSRQPSRTGVAPKSHAKCEVPPSLGAWRYLNSEPSWADADPKSWAKCAVQPPSGDAAGGSSHDVPRFAPSSRVDPCGEALLVQRRHRPSVFQQRLLKQEQEMHEQQANVALGLASITGALCLRLAAYVAGVFGLRFLDYLLAYTVVTLRVCLLVLLVLF